MAFGFSIMWRQMQSWHRSHEPACLCRSGLLSSWLVPLVSSMWGSPLLYLTSSPPQSLFPREPGPQRGKSYPQSPVQLPIFHLLTQKLPLLQENLELYDYSLRPHSLPMGVWPHLLLPIVGTSSGSSFSRSSVPSSGKW